MLCSLLPAVAVVAAAAAAVAAACFEPCPCSIRPRVAEVLVMLSRLPPPVPPPVSSLLL